MSRKPETPWMEVLNSSLLKRIFSSQEMRTLINKAQERYMTWEVFRHQKIPAGFKLEQAWAFLKMNRLGTEWTPIKDKNGSYFTYNLTKSLYKRLSLVDTNASGLVKTLSTDASAAQKEQLIMSGLTEEAIASSQIEGASTSRKVAKEMLYSGRKPTNTSEQMIINNYQVMQLLADLKDLELTEDMLLDIQRRITNKTLEDAADAGRFRVDADQIAVVDHATGEIAFIPPVEQLMREELRNLIRFANADDSTDNSFTHPFLKATLLHFWLAYLHPFVDGNGRTARALFYWYLLKKGYWLFEYLSVSRIIKTSKKRYDDSFINTETDDNDLTYFISYISEVTCRAIDEMKKYYEKKLSEFDERKRIARILSALNERQIALLQYFLKNKSEVTDIKRHQLAHGVVYETARNDLLQLKLRGFLVETEQGRRKKIYVPNMRKIQQLFSGETSPDKITRSSKKTSASKKHNLSIFPKG